VGRPFHIINLANAAVDQVRRAAWNSTRRAGHVLFRAWVLKKELRDRSRLPPGRRPDAHLDAWLARASRGRIQAMLDLSRTIRRHRDQILAAVDLGLSNSKLEDSTARSASSTTAATATTAPPPSSP
jgi:transposase